jgi:hypothetical protein
VLVRGAGDPDPPRVEEDFRPARKAHPALLVEGLDELVGILAGSGATLRSDEPLEGYACVYVDDPFGNRIELLEPASPGLGAVSRPAGAPGAP